MAVDREIIDLALEAKLQKLVDDGDIVTLSRNVKNYTEVPAILQPALFIMKTNEVSAQDKGSPGLTTLMYDLVIYTNSGNLETIIRATQFNTVLDKLDAVLAPDPVRGFQDLDGQVSHAWREGDTEITEGTLNEQSVVVTPMKILLNQDGNNNKGQFWFDSGTLWARPLEDSDGQPMANPTPIRLGNLKGISLDVDQELSFARTTQEFKVRAAGGEKTIRGTAALGKFNARAINQILFGQQTAAGAKLIKNDDRSTIPGTPFQITPTVPGSGTWDEDLGACFTSDGTPLRRVTAAPAAGEYTAIAGVYTFNAADTAKEVSISFLYDISGGESLVIANRFKQESPSFEIILQGVYNGQQVAWVLNKCVTDAFSLPSTTESFMIQNFEFEAIADLSGNVGTIGLGPTT